MPRKSEQVRVQLESLRAVLPEDSSLEHTDFAGRLQMAALRNYEADLLRDILEPEANANLATRGQQSGRDDTEIIETTGSWKGRFAGLLGLLDTLGQPTPQLLVSHRGQSRAWKFDLIGTGLPIQDRRDHLPWAGDTVQISLSSGRNGTLAYFAYVEPSVHPKSLGGILRLVLRTSDGQSSEIRFGEGGQKKRFKGATLPSDPMLVCFELSIE